MRVIKRVRHMAQVAEALRRRGERPLRQSSLADGGRIGFVPTMGALHEGHLSLIRSARKETDAVVVSIFVNPLQFGPKEDFARYPRDLPRDIALAAREGTDVVFAPSVEEMYPEGCRTTVEVEGLSDQLEGAMRPGHFRGVTTVVAKLFHIVQPTTVYVGQKDYQQAVIITRMVEDVNIPVRIHVLPTVREPDGLAMSSRNRDLTAAQRQHAAVIYRALQDAHAAIRQGERSVERLRARIRKMLRAQPLVRVQDLSIVDAKMLTPLKVIRGQAAVLVAARIGNTRLIDNLLVDVT